MKAQLRSEKLEKRIKHKTKLQAKKSAQIIKKITALPIFKEAKNILFYLPIHGEVDLSKLFSKKKNFVLPRVKGKTLQLHIIKDLTHTTKGAYNILEPNKNLPKIKPSDIDLALIPGVVFSKTGHRIGYGKGHYDRLLPKTVCPKIGIAYEFQMVNNTAGESHDVPMDMIITEKRTLNF